MSARQERPDRAGATEERAREGVEHLQAAAIELIEAARAFLDVAEELVKDPGDVVALAEAAAQVVASARPAGGTGRRAEPEDAESAPPRVQHIRVS